jgi:hypothetical protein
MSLPNFCPIVENQLRAMDMQISVQSDSSFGHQGAKTENTKSAITSELMPVMAGSPSNFYHR